MTLKEKWCNDHPGMQFNPYEIPCPFVYDYEDNVSDCSTDNWYTCANCWEREFKIKTEVNNPTE